MSSRIFQSVIMQIKEATDRCIGIIDDQGFVITCSELPMIGSRLDDFSSMNYDFSEPVQVSGMRTYKVLSNNSGKFDYAVFVEGCDDMARVTCMMAAVAFNEAKMNYEEKYNKAAFLKNIISDNILPGDVYVRTKELHFAPDVPRALLLVRQVERSDVASVEVLQSLFPDKQHDFVISINENDIVVIKELPGGDNSAEVKAIAESIETVLRNELQIKCIIGIGTTARHLRELADRYKEAQIPRKPLSATKTSASAVLYISCQQHCVRCFSMRCSRKIRSRPWMRIRSKRLISSLRITSTSLRPVVSCMSTATRSCIVLKR